MKIILLAAAAALAGPAIAQDMSNGGQSTAGTPAGQQTADPSSSTTAPAPTDQGQMNGANGAMQPGQTMGGQPMQGQPMGAQPMQGQGMASTEPAPAPMDHYPVCKPGQYDKCMERGGGSSSGHRMAGHHMKVGHHTTMRHRPAKKMVRHTKTSETTATTQSQ